MKQEIKSGFIINFKKLPIYNDTLTVAYTIEPVKYYDEWDDCCGRGSGITYHYDIRDKKQINPFETMDEAYIYGEDVITRAKKIYEQTENELKEIKKYLGNI